MKKLLIYGGTFNPVHRAHMHLAEEFRRVTGADRVLLIPARLPPHKEVPELASARDRLNMCRLAAAEKPGFSVSSLELLREGPSYTADTLEVLAKENPGTRLYFVTGEDMFLTLLDWHDPERILKLAAVCGAPRSLRGLSKMEAYAKRIWERGGEALVADIAYMPVSSTQVREAVKAGGDITALVPNAVAQYIVSHELYRE